MALEETFEVGEMDREQTFELYNGKPLAEQVADHIVNYIVENEMEAGAKLPNEFELAERIGEAPSARRLRYWCQGILWKSEGEPGPLCRSRREWWRTRWV